MAKMADDTSFEQRYISRDISILGNTIFAAPYSLDVEYSLDDSYEVFFEEQCSVNVNKKNTPVYSGSFSFCAVNSNLEIVYSDVIGSGLILFEKTDEMFEVSAIE